MTDKDGTIYFMDAGRELRPMNQMTYANEADLQSLIGKYPELLAGDQIAPDDPLRWLHVAREVGVPGHEGGANRWAIDNLFLDQNGVPTLVEVKRSTDTRIRREVVGQLLEYAANVSTYWDPDFIRNVFEISCEETDQDPTALILSFAGTDALVGYEEFWSKVSNHLRAGHLRLLFVADAIPAELRRIVEFLNEQMNPVEVLAVELRQYANNDSRALVPIVLGMTTRAEAKRAKNRQNKRWDEDSFFGDLESRHGDEAVNVAQRLLRWADSRGSNIWWGQGKTYASFVPVLSFDDVWYGLFRCETKKPQIELYFGHLQNRGLLSLQHSLQIRDRLNRIEGISLVRAEGYPDFNLLALSPSDSFNHFTLIFDEIIDLIIAQHNVSARLSDE